MRRINARRDYWKFVRNISTFDEATQSVEPFPIDWPWLHRFHDEIEDNRLNLVLKSRQMFVSNYYASRFLWKAWRADLRQGTSFNSVIVSKRKEDAEELMRRAQIMYDSLPADYKEGNPVTIRSKTQLGFRYGGRILILPSGAHIGRTYTISESLMDEAAFHEYAHQTHAAMQATHGTTGKVNVVSTPNGKFNLFYDLWADSGYNRIKIHWSDHPDRDESWMAEARRGYASQEDWDREQELSFAVSGGRRVYPTFGMASHVIPFEKHNIVPRHDRPMYRGWDFGYLHPAVVWWQFSDSGQVLVFNYALGTEVDLYEWVPMVQEMSAAQFGAKMQYVDCCDPAGNQRGDITGRKGEKTSVEVLRGFGIHPKSKRLGDKKHYNDIVRSLLRRGQDAKAGLIVDEASGCFTKRHYNDKERWEQVLIDGFLGGYVLKSRKLPIGEIFEDTPLKDGWYDHVFDALEYSVATAFNIRGRRRQGVTEKEDLLGRTPSGKQKVQTKKQQRRVMGG